MRRHKVLAVAVGLIAVTGLSGCDMIKGYFSAQRHAKDWDGPVKEITYEKLDKDGKVFDVELHSRIDAPIDKVWQAMKTPEKLSEYSDQYKKSELISADGNKKVLELHVMALGNLQQFKVELNFDDDAKRVDIKTIQANIADIDGSYQLEPSPDGTKTMYVYKAKNTDKIALPISVDVQRSALKEAFVNQIRAIKKQIGIS